MAKGRRVFVEEADVETLAFDWGRLWWLSEPRVTGATRFTTGIVQMETGKGHSRHNHPGCEEIIYVLNGRALMGIELDGKTLEKEVAAGTLQYIPEGAYHWTRNLGTAALRVLVVYSPTGPEDALRADPSATILPPARS